MHDVTNQAKNIMNDLPKKRQTFSDGMIFLASKMEIQRFAFSSIFTVTVIAMWFLSVARNMVRTLKKWQEKFVSTFSKSLIYFASFMKELKERHLSRTTASLMYFGKDE